MALLSKSQVLGAEDYKTMLVYVPEWGGEIRIRGLSGAEFAKLQACNQAMQKGVVANGGSNALAVALGAIDERGMALFTEPEAAALGKKNAGLLMYIADMIWELTGCSEVAQEAIAKKSNRTPTSDSGTSSPAESPAS